MREKKRLDPDEPLTTAEAAAELNVTPGRVRQLVLAGLPAKKHGRDLFIRRGDLDLVRDRKVGRPRKQRD